MPLPVKFINEVFKVEQILPKLNGVESQSSWAVPEMQREFVWKDAQILKFLTSMYKGYPVGALMYWENATVSSHLIGHNPLTHKNTGRAGLIVDGQQRLTSLMIIFEGMKVFRKRGTVSVKIQFNPTLHPDSPDQRFELITKNGTLRHKHVNILDVLTQTDSNGKLTRRANSHKFIKEYIKNNELTEEEEENVSLSCDRLLDLYSFAIPCVKLIQSTTHEEATEIFVRINNSGTRLDMANFIMTTLAVKNQKLKDAIHRFADEASESPIFTPEPINALTALIGYTFALPAGPDAFNKLRGIEGKNAPSTKLQEENIAELEGNINYVCDTDKWDDFIDAVSSAGICSKKYLASEAALITAYSIYLYLEKFNDVKKETRRNAISLWILFCTLTRRYSSHTDTKSAEDLSRFQKLKSANEIIQKIYDVVNLQLPDEQSIVPFARDTENILTICLAQQNAKTLFSKQLTIRQAIITGAKKGKLDEHHLFPKAFMKGLHKSKHPNLKDEELDSWVNLNVDVNANLAPINSTENREILDKSPKIYAEKIKLQYTDNEWNEMCSTYALPSGWWELEFDDFIKQRAMLLPKVIIKSLNDLRTLNSK